MEVVVVVVVEEEEEGEEVERKFGLRWLRISCANCAHRQAPATEAPHAATSTITPLHSLSSLCLLPSVVVWLHLLALGVVVAVAIPLRSLAMIRSVARVSARLAATRTQATHLSTASPVGSRSSSATTASLYIPGSHRVIQPRLQMGQSRSQYFMLVGVRLAPLPLLLLLSCVDGWQCSSHCVPLRSAGIGRVRA